MSLIKTKKSSHLSLSKLQSPITTQWLNNNYFIEEGVSLPRSSLYSHYMDFCSNNRIVPVNAASFGKIIRNTFPNLRTRRLGTRGQSKYHYYGITVRKSSPYYQMVLHEQLENARMAAEASQRNSKAAQNACNNETSDTKASQPKKKPSKSTAINKNDNNKKTVRRSSTEIVPSMIAPGGGPASQQNISISSQILSTGTLLPEFPSDEVVETENAKLRDKIKTFLIMYKTHCQRILDTILRANFAEVQNFLIHFWQGIPSHIAVILTENCVVDLIRQCDNILYKAIGSVLIPSSLQPLPPSLNQAIQQFAKDISQWLAIALCDLPEELQRKKMLVAKSFAQQLVRLTSLSHLAQAARTVMINTDAVAQMSMDFREIPVNDIIKTVTWITSSANDSNGRTIYKYFNDMFMLLEHQAPIEEYANWLSIMILHCVVKPSEQGEVSFQSLAQSFLLRWSFITSKIIQELTLRSAKSFGSFHLLQMLFDDYIFYKIESHADISEEIDECPPENRVMSFLRSKSSVESATQYNYPYQESPSLYDENEYVISPLRSLMKTKPTIPSPSLPSSYPNLTMFENSHLALHLPSSPVQTDDHATQMKYNERSEVKNFLNNNNNDIGSPTMKSSDQYYTEDLELVRQLQEKTKSLMDASSRYNTTNSFGSMYEDHSLHYEKQLPQQHYPYQDPYATCGFEK